MPFPMASHPTDHGLLPSALTPMTLIGLVCLPPHRTPIHSFLHSPLHTKAPLGSVLGPTSLPSATGSIPQSQAPCLWRIYPSLTSPWRSDCLLGICHGTSLKNITSSSHAERKNTTSSSIYRGPYEVVNKVDIVRTFR